jgi:hypothetical protein
MECKGLLLKREILRHGQTNGWMKDEEHDGNVACEHDGEMAYYA